MRNCVLIVALFLGSGSFPAQEPPVLMHGGWAATAGPSQVFRGTWTAQVPPDRPNMAQGSWTLLAETGQILLEGTWSAQKARAGWQGTWTARTLNGRSFSGTWKADITDLGPKTFKEMLERAAENEVAGWWRSGPYQGNWWLKGSPRKAAELIWDLGILDWG
jgi:hypothetical protein